MARKHFIHTALVAAVALAGALAPANIATSSVFAAPAPTTPTTAPLPSTPRHLPQWFNRRISYWGEVDDDFIDYLAATKPQQAQVGFFGPEYYSALGYMKETGKTALWAPLGG